MWRRIWCTCVSAATESFLSFYASPLTTWFKEEHRDQEMMAALHQHMPTILEEARKADLGSLKALHPAPSQVVTSASVQFAYCFRKTEPKYHVLTNNSNSELHRGYSTAPFTIAVMAVPSGPHAPQRNRSAEDQLITNFFTRKTNT